MNKLQSYCSLLYERMNSEATIEENLKVWRGKVISTCLELGIPEGSYSKVVNKLRSMGCIEQVMRGYRGSAPSVFTLQYPPTSEVWDRSISGTIPLTDGPTLDRMAAMLEDLRRQIGGVNLVDALVNIEERLSKLETAVKESSTNSSTKLTN